MANIKSICKTLLYLNVTSKNALKIYKLAHLYNCDSLETKSFELLKKYVCLVKVMFWFLHKYSYYYRKVIQNFEKAIKKRDQLIQIYELMESFTVDVKEEEKLDIYA